VGINKLISFSDPRLGQLLLNEDLHKLLSSYYGRQHYIRNHPVIMKTDWRQGQPINYNGNYHVDHLHQLSLMLAVSDIHPEDTHTEYAMGSHKYVRTSIGPNGNCYSRKYVYDHYKIAHACGPKGTLFIFDTCGLHAGKYQESKNPRKMLHMNVTNGHDMESAKFTKRIEWPELEQYDKNSALYKSYEKILI
jgi:hypothetical protein